MRRQLQSAQQSAMEWHQQLVQIHHDKEACMVRSLQAYRDSTICLSNLAEPPDAEAFPCALDKLSCTGC